MSKPFKSQFDLMAEAYGNVNYNKQKLINEDTAGKTVIGYPPSEDYEEPGPQLGGDLDPGEVDYDVTEAEDAEEAAQGLVQVLEIQSLHVLTEELVKHTAHLMRESEAVKKHACEDDSIS